jgi:hypothetical protein
MNSDSKCLSFILLHAFVKRQYGFHTGDILATYCNPTGNTDKTDARMTPEALDIKAGYCKDAFGYGGNAATDEPSSTELSQR